MLVGPRAAGAIRTARLDHPRQVEAAGFPEPLDAWSASADGDGGSSVAAAPRDEVTLLGRGAELEALRLAYLRAVRERRPHLVLVVGEAGAGKTRLARELIASVRSEDPAPLLLAGRNPPYGGGIAFWALGEQLRAAAGTSRDAGATEVHEALGDRLRDLDAPEPEQTAATLAATLAGGSAPREAAAVRRAWRRLIAGLADDRPVLIAVDDLHWADDGYLDLIEDVAELPAQALMIVCTARPEIDARRPGLAEGENRERLALGPLPPLAAEELAAKLVAGDDLELAREIAATSGGNSFFTEEIACAIREEGKRDHKLPDTVQGAITSRLDRLPGAQKRAIQCAAVLGDRFEAAALGELLGEDPSVELEALEAGACSSAGRRSRTAMPSTTS